MPYIKGPGIVKQTTDYPKTPKIFTQEYTFALDNLGENSIRVSRESLSNSPGILHNVKERKTPRKKKPIWSP